MPLELGDAKRSKGGNDPVALPACAAPEGPPGRRCSVPGCGDGQRPPARRAGVGPAWVLPGSGVGPAWVLRGSAVGPAWVWRGSRVGPVRAWVQGRVRAWAQAWARAWVRAWVPAAAAGGQAQTAGGPAGAAPGCPTGNLLLTEIQALLQLSGRGWGRGRSAGCAAPLRRRVLGAHQRVMTSFVKGVLKSNRYGVKGGKNPLKMDS